MDQRHEMRLIIYNVFGDTFQTYAPAHFLEQIFYVVFANFKMNYIAINNTQINAKFNAE
jgi:hypothetical protein